MGRSYTDIKYDLWYNLEEPEIKPGNIALAVKGNPGNKIFSYSAKPYVGTNNGVKFKNGALEADLQKYLSFPPQDLRDEITIFFDVEVGSNPTTEWRQLCQRRDVLAPSVIPFEFRINCDYLRSTNNLQFAYFVSGGWHLWDALNLPYGVGDKIKVSTSFKYGTGSSIAGYLNGDAVAGSWKLGDGTANIPADSQNITIGSVPWTSIYESADGPIKSGLILDTVLLPGQQKKLAQIDIWKPRPNISYFDQAFQDSLLPTIMNENLGKKLYNGSIYV